MIAISRFSRENKCYRGCRNEYFHNFKYECIYDIKLTNITNNVIVNLTISGRSMNLYDLNEKLTFARHNGLILIQIIKLTLKFSSHLRYRNISYYHIFRRPMCHRQFFRKTSQNQEFLNNFCNDNENPFHFA